MKSPIIITTAIKARNLCRCRIWSRGTGTAYGPRDNISPVLQPGHTAGQCTGLTSAIIITATIETRYPKLCGIRSTDCVLQNRKTTRR